ncbi:receptor-like protein kinase FERONIA [Tanacetum coccineum]
MDKGNGEAEKLTSSTSEQPSRRFTIADIQSATNNFDDELVIGQGGFGKVYKGQISIEESSHFVAIKRLDSMSNQGAAEFKAEIEMLSNLRHLRLKIAIGAGRGLDYLHTGFGTQHGVIHRDVKSSNILLDENLAAMISDFGLSKIGPIDQTAYNVSVSVKGTFGYLDPEYFYTSKLTRKTDVYAFGVVLFELLSGKLAMDRDIEGQGFAGTTEEMRQFCRFASDIGIQLDDSSVSGLELVLTYLRHPNVVKLIGYCLEGVDPCLCRLKIAIGAGRGLDYLHAGFGTQLRGVIHRDVKSSNILLDENWAAMISDFGLSKIGPIDQASNNISVSVKGTFGYLDPEYFYTSKLTRKTGMYAFGVVLFELLSGKLAVDTRLEEQGSLARWAQKCVKERKFVCTGCGQFFRLLTYRKNGTDNSTYSPGDNGIHVDDLVRTIRLLPLATKVKIAVGIARGIVYLCNTTDNVGKLVSYFSQDSELYEWDKTICAFELDKYKILLNEYDITKLVEDRDYDKRDLQYHITGLIDGDYYPGSPEVDFTLETKLFSSFRSVFTEVLTGRKFSLEEFHKIDYSLRKDGKQSLGLRHLRGEGTFNHQIQSSPYLDAGEESIPESMRIAHIIQKRLFFSNRW